MQFGWGALPFEPVDDDDREIEHGLKTPATGLTRARQKGDGYIRKRRGQTARISECRWIAIPRYHAGFANEGVGQFRQLWRPATVP